MMMIVIMDSSFLSEEANLFLVKNIFVFLEKHFGEFSVLKIQFLKALYSFYFFFLSLTKFIIYNFF